MQTATEPIQPASGNGAGAPKENFSQRARRERDSAMSKTWGVRPADDGTANATPEAGATEQESGKPFELNEETISKAPAEQQALLRFMQAQAQGGQTLKQQVDLLQQLIMGDGSDGADPAPSKAKGQPSAAEVFEFPEIQGYEGIKDPMTAAFRIVLQDGENTRKAVEALAKRLDATSRTSEQERFENANPDWQRYEQDIKAKFAELGVKPTTAKGMTALLKTIKAEEKLRASESAAKANAQKGGSVRRDTSSSSVRGALANHTANAQPSGLRGAWGKAKKDNGLEW